MPQYLSQSSITDQDLYYGSDTDANRIMSITEYSNGQLRSFYSEAEYRAYQKQEAEETWNGMTDSEKLCWWVTKMIFGYSRTPVYGMYSSLIGIPGWKPGTRIPYAS